MGEVCAYCATEVLTGRERPEHPIPAALGSRLSVRTVCDGCNTWAGREIDQPFLDEALIREDRSFFDQRDPRRGTKARRVASPLLRGTTVEGDWIAFDHDRQRPVMGSRIIDRGSGRYQIRTSSQAEADRLIDRLARQAANENKQLRVESVDTTANYLPINVEFTLHAGVWRREAAKIGLAVGAHVYPPTWRHESHAHLLREWLNDRDQSTADGTAPPLVPTHGTESLALLAPTQQHTIWFQHADDDSILMMVGLFGRTFFAVPVHSGLANLPAEAWSLDWRAGGVHLTTWEQLVLDAVSSMPSGSNGSF